jgi:hypothetical protein
MELWAGVMAMSNTALERIEADLDQLSLADQLWLIERLAQRIRHQAQPHQSLPESQLAAMASDPDIQRELREIEAEFEGTEFDGLVPER